METTLTALLNDNSNGILEIRTVAIIQNGRHDRYILVETYDQDRRITLPHVMSQYDAFDLCDMIAEAGGLVDWGNG